jgi:hypothetical protein
LSLSCLCAVAYTSNVFAAEAVIEAGDESGGSAAAAVSSDARDEAAEMADSESSSEPGDAEGEREAKNAIYVDLLGPGLFYSINYDRMLTVDLSALLVIVHDWLPDMSPNRSAPMLREVSSVTVRLAVTLMVQKSAVWPGPVATMPPLQRLPSPHDALASAIHVPLALNVVTLMATMAKSLCPAASVTRTVK